MSGTFYKDPFRLVTIFQDIMVYLETYSVKLSNLKESTIYYVRVVSTNTANRTNKSNMERFTTLPESTEPQDGRLAH